MGKQYDKRSKAEILHDILKYIYMNRDRKFVWTNFMYKANLNYRSLKYVKKYLIENDLIVELPLMQKVVLTDNGLIQYAKLHLLVTEFSIKSFNPNEEEE